MLEYGIESIVNELEIIAEQEVKEEENATTDLLRLLTVAEVAAYLRLDPTTVRRYIAKGLINAIELPHADKRVSYRIRYSELLRILEGK